VTPFLSECGSIKNPFLFGRIHLSLRTRIAQSDFFSEDSSCHRTNDRCTQFPQFVKAGFAGSNFPASIFPSMVGRPILRSEEKVEGIEIKVRKFIF
jgi:hypothetical protein